MKEYRFKINGKDYTVCINSVNNGVADLSVNGKQYEVEISQPENAAATSATDQPAQASLAQPAYPTGPQVTAAPAFRQAAASPMSAQPAAAATSPNSQPAASSQSNVTGKCEEVKAPLPGVIINISVNIGDKVKEGQEVAVLEAMKMENSIEASVAGTVTAINVYKGDSVPEGAVILTITA